MSDGLERLAEGLWTATDPVKILGMRLTATMCALELDDDEVAVYSPLRLTEERRRAVADLGRLRCVVAPNLFHHLHVGDWLEAFPEAELHAPANLPGKRPDLEVDRALGTPAPRPLRDSVTEITIDGFRLEETALLHHASGSLLVADLVHNVGQPKGLWTSTYTRLMGFHDRVALSRMIRWTAFSERAAARASIERLLRLPWHRLVVGHGSPVESDAKQALRKAFGWLLHD